MILESSKFVVTLNAGGALCASSRDSHQHAAQRWGAVYIELREPWGRLSHHGVFATKLEMDRLPLLGRVVWLDADTLVRDDCPSLFDLIPPGHFGGVCNFQNDTHGPRGDDPFPDHASTYIAVAARMRSSSRYRPETYINGGVMVFDLPDHGRVWEHIRATLPDHHVDAMYEQTAVNVAIADLSIPLTVLPREFNRLGRAAWHCGSTMTDYIIHCANLGALRGDKHGPLSRINWETKGSTHERKDSERRNGAGAVGNH